MKGARIAPLSIWGGVVGGPGPLDDDAILLALVALLIVVAVASAVVFWVGWR